jgi:hypothetical protein
MPKICYRAKKFSDDRMDKINKANAIITEYRNQGFELTLRQLYYQFVSRDFIANNMREYKNLGDIINDARLAGLVDWDAIVDRTRDLKSLAHWSSPADIVDACARQFRVDKWVGQPRRVEVWIEKDALVGVIEGVCNELDVAYFSCRGYTSQSEMWSAAMRLKAYRDGDQEPLVLHLGDHDPSGKDMTRDITDRLTEFSYGDIEVKRLALNMNQVEQYNPPPNPAKITDSRAEGYIAEFGAESWELDALEPAVIAQLIRENVVAVRDEAQWNRKVAEEKTAREQLTKVSNNWEEITENLPEDEE